MKKFLLTMILLTACKGEYIQLSKEISDPFEKAVSCTYLTPTVQCLPTCRPTMMSVGSKRMAIVKKITTKGYYSNDPSEVVTEEDFEVVKYLTKCRDYK